MPYRLRFFSALAVTVMASGLNSCGGGRNTNTGESTAGAQPSGTAKTPAAAASPRQSSSAAHPSVPTGDTASVNISELLPQERQDLIADLAVRLERNPGIEAYLLAGDKLESDGSRRILLLSNSAGSTIYGGEVPKGAVPLEFAGNSRDGPGVKVFNDLLLKNGFEKGYDDNALYLLNCEVAIYGRDLVIGFGDQIMNSRR